MKKLSFISGKLVILCIVLIALCIAALQGGWWIYQRAMIEPFVADPTLELSSGQRRDFARRRAAYESWGVDTSIPCVPEEGVDVVVPHKIRSRLGGGAIAAPTLFQKGEVVHTNFFSDFPSGYYRTVEFTHEGHRPMGRHHEDAIHFDDLVDLYEAYIEDNGLEAQFETESGQPYSRRSAEQALLNTDRQLYQIGYSEKAWYPFSKTYVAGQIDLFTFLGPVLIVILCIVFSFLFDALVNRRYFAAWNVENKRRHDRVQLNQFNSLSEFQEVRKRKRK